MNMTKIYLSRCECGGITIFYGNKSFSCKETNFPRFFPNFDLEGVEEIKTSYICDHCTNHYGLDLCACGSGEPYESCSNGFDVCGKPMQSVKGGYSCVRANDAMAPMNADCISEDALIDSEDDSNSPALQEEREMDLGTQVLELKAMEEKLQKTANDLITSIIDKIRLTEVPGVTNISKEPICYIVSLRTVLANGKSNLSAEYYSGEAQANLVKKALAAYMKNGSISGVLDKLMEISNKQAVTVNKTTYALNSTTMGILNEVCAVLE